MAKVLLVDLSSAHFPVPADYRDLFSLRLKAQELIRERWNADLRKRGALTYSRGLLSIAASLERAGHQVVYKRCGFGPSRISSDVLQDVNVVGITCVAPTFPIAVDALRKVKHLNSDILTVLGGPHVTYLSEEVLARYAPVVDAVVRGEGEITMTEIANHPHDLACIRGITYRASNQSERRAISRNPDRECCELARLPQPSYHLLPFPLSNYSLNLMTSRGCRFGCTYCIDGRYFSKLRLHAVKQVIDELAYVADRVPPGTLIHFCDSVFDVETEYLRELTRNIRAMSFTLKFSGDLRVSTVDEERVALMSEAGFIQYCVGVESGDNSLLARHKQKQSLQESTRACKIIRGVDERAFITAYWLAGLPGTSIHGLRNDTEVMNLLIRENIVNIISNKIFVPYPGTPIFDEPERFGLRILHRDWSKYLRSHVPVYHLDTLSAESLFEHFMAQDRTLIDAYCEVLDIDPAELDRVEPTDYVFQQHFSSSSAVQM